MLFETQKELNSKKVDILKCVVGLAFFASYLRGIPPEHQRDFTIDHIHTDVQSSLLQMIGTSASPQVVHFFPRMF